MISSKKIFLFIKSVFAVVAFLILILFFYSAFFYEPPSIEKKVPENQITKEDVKLKLEQEKQKLEEKELEKKISETKQKKIKKLQVKTTIKDGIFATVGNKAITKSDIVNEIKIILILNNLRYSEDKKEELQKMGIRSAIKRNVKEIEIERNKDFLNFNPEDLNKELKRLAGKINIDIETLKIICKDNDLDFSLIENNIKVELLWNSLIFALYRDKLKINAEEIEDQLKAAQNKKESYEYLISEIIIKPVEKDKLKSRISELKNKIKIEGFESVALSESISPSAINGGDLGWLNENKISKKYMSKITNTSVGNLTEAILMQNGILIFKIRNKKKIEVNLNLEDIKNQLVQKEKEKILNMYSLAHYDNLKRSMSLKFFNE